MITHQVLNTTLAALSLCKGAFKLAPGVVGYIPDELLEHPDIQGALKRGRLVFDSSTRVEPEKHQTEPELAYVPEPVAKRRYIRNRLAKDQDSSS